MGDVSMKTLLAYETYLAGKSIKEQTRRNYIKIPKALLTYLNKEIEEITQDDIDEYVRYCIRTRMHNGNATRFRILHYFFKWTGQNYELPMLSMKRTLKAVLNQEQTEQLFETVEEMSSLHQLVFYLEYDAIRRPYEITNIKIPWRNNDVLYYEGKTHQDYILMTNRLMEAWDEYVEYERPKPRDETQAPYLILGKNNNSYWNGAKLRTNLMITRLIKEIVHESGVDIPLGESPTNYLIKRTSITRQLKSGVDPKIIQHQAGHSNLSQTMEYNRLTEFDIRRYVQNVTWGYKKKHGKSYRKKPSPTPYESDSRFVL